MKFYKIKNMGLRRVAMVAALPFVAVEYVVRSLIALVRDMRALWSYEHP